MRLSQFCRTSIDVFFRALNKWVFGWKLLNLYNETVQNCFRKVIFKLRFDYYYYQNENKIYAESSLFSLFIGWELFDPFVPVEVPAFSQGELDVMIDYFVEKK